MRKPVEITKEDLLFMYQIFSATKTKVNKNLTYCISYNKKTIESEALSLIDAMAPSDSYVEFEEKRNSIIDKYVEKDSATGSFIKSVDGKGLKIKKEFVSECKTELKKLEDEYEVLVKQREGDIKQFDNILKETVNIELEFVDWDDIPEDIDQTLMDALLPIVNKKD